jgi:hypothetical protein
LTLRDPPTLKNAGLDGNLLLAGVERDNVVEFPHVQLQSIVYGRLAAHAEPATTNRYRPTAALNGCDYLFDAMRRNHARHRNRIQLGDVIDHVFMELAGKIAVTRDPDDQGDDNGVAGQQIPEKTQNFAENPLDADRYTVARRFHKSEPHQQDAATISLHSIKNSTLVHRNALRTA